MERIRSSWSGTSRFTVDSLMSQLLEIVEVELMGVRSVPEDVTFLVLEVEVDDRHARVLVDPDGDHRPRGGVPCEGRRGEDLDLLSLLHTLQYRPNGRPIRPRAVGMTASSYGPTGMVR